MLSSRPSTSTYHDQSAMLSIDGDFSTSELLDARPQGRMSHASRTMSSSASFRFDIDAERETIDNGANSKSVRWMKVAIMVSFLVVAVVVSVVLYLHLQRREYASFASLYDQRVQAIVERLQVQFENRIVALTMLRMYTVSFATSKPANAFNQNGTRNTSWPFVTVPDFDRQVSNSRHLLGGSLGLFVLPIVHDDDRKDYEAYTVANVDWIGSNNSDDMIFPELVRVQDDNDGISPMGSVTVKPDPGPGPYTPFWQSSPIVPDVVNLDAMSLPLFQQGIMEIMSSQQMNIGRTTSLSDENRPSFSFLQSVFLSTAEQLSATSYTGYEPISVLFVPIFNGFLDDSNGNDVDLEAMFVDSIHWQELLHAGVEVQSDDTQQQKQRQGNVVENWDVVFVLKNACDEMDTPSHTFLFNGISSTYLGKGDFHDPRNDSNARRLQRHFYTFDPHQIAQKYGERIRIDAPSSTCLYTVHVYLQDKSQNASYRSKNPMISTIYMTLVFVFMLFGFLLYDCVVENRQRSVMQTALEARAIVASLYPKVVRDRLFGDARQRSRTSTTRARARNSLQNIQTGRGTRECIGTSNDPNGQGRGNRPMSTRSLIAALPSASNVMLNSPSARGGPLASIPSESNLRFTGEETEDVDPSLTFCPATESDVTALDSVEAGLVGNGGNNLAKDSCDGESHTQSVNGASGDQQDADAKPETNSTDDDQVKNFCKTRAFGDRRSIISRQQLKSYLASDETSICNQNNLLETHLKPIADLFPQTTVLFADIVGFTSWSSQREPTQVFILLQTLYRAFDKIARKRSVFKVETIGDCYMAVTGLPDPQDDHAWRMVGFALECRAKMLQVTLELEVTLGPDTGELGMRFGMHSGAVTAGVLRGERSHFQLFGDTVNTASRMESTGKRNRIQISQATADLLRRDGKYSWIRPRQDVVTAKGKGEVKTFWVASRPRKCDNDDKNEEGMDETNKGHSECEDKNTLASQCTNSAVPRRPRRPTSIVREVKASTDSSFTDLMATQASRRSSLSDRSSGSDYTDRYNSDYVDAIIAEDLIQRDNVDEQPNRPSRIPSLSEERMRQRSIDWQVEILVQGLKLILVRRSRQSKTSGNTLQRDGAAVITFNPEGSKSLDEVQEVMMLPSFDYWTPTQQSQSNSTQQEQDENLESVSLPDSVVSQLTDYVSKIASMYRSSNEFHNFHHACHVTMSANSMLNRIVIPECTMNTELARDLHLATDGISSDPVAQFAILFSALIHDVDHTGVHNDRLAVEEPHLAEIYGNRSIAEQKSIDIAWELLMENSYSDLRYCICANNLDELLRFRQFVVNCVIATDLVDVQQQQKRKERWETMTRWFEGEKGADNEGDQESKDHENGHSRTKLLRNVDKSNLRATLVIEHLMQAADIAHTMQHWLVFRRWNELSFQERFSAFQAGRVNDLPNSTKEIEPDPNVAAAAEGNDCEEQATVAAEQLKKESNGGSSSNENDPSKTWYQDQLDFFDNFVIPLAQKLQECNLFGDASSSEFLRYAMSNRDEWAEKGRDIVQEMALAHNSRVNQNKRLSLEMSNTVEA